MTAPPALPGPRPPSPAEQEAYILHLQRTPLETIEKQTGLRRPQITAAIDLVRLHSQAAMQTVVADPEPTAEPPRVRVRTAVMPQLPGATIPPGPALPAAAKEHLAKPVKQPAKPVDRDEKIRTLTGLIEVMRKHLAAYETELAELLGTEAPAPAADPPPSPGPAPRPDLADSPEVRTWAAADGWAVPVAGARLPGGIVHAYLKAHGGTQ